MITLDNIDWVAARDMAEAIINSEPFFWFCVALLIILFGYYITEMWSKR